MILRRFGVVVGVAVASALALSACSSGDGGAATATSTPTPTVATAQQKAAEAARIAKAPTVLTVACRPAGITVGGVAVAARKDGVHLTTSSSPAAAEVRYLATSKQTPDQQFAGTVEASRTRSSSVIPAPPGTLELTCTTPKGQRIGPAKTVSVYDRDSFYRAVDIEAELGCRPDQPADGPSAPPRATSSEALDKLMDTIPGKGTFTYVPGPGYSGSTSDAVLVKQDAKGFGTAVSQLQPNGSFIARLTSTC